MMDLSKTKFSIILPVYNVEKYLERCIKSILKQTYTNFELICVNDASPDNSLQILERFAKFDERILIINNPENIGLGASRNKALEKVSGDYVTCIDSDDWVDETFLENFIKGFQNDADSVWVKHWKYIENIDFATISPAFPKYIHRLEGFININPTNILDFPAYAWNKCYKSNLIKENEFHWLENVYFEDMYFYYDYFMKYNKVYLMNELLYYYRVREGSIISRKDTKLKKIKNMFYVLTEIYKLIDNRQYNTEFKTSIIMSAKRYKNQYIHSEYAKETQEEFDKFMALT